MLTHYIKFAIRNFRSNKVIFAGSLATLCLGALCISLLFSYVHNELTMDDFHKDVEDIYMVTMKPSPKAEWVGPFKFEGQEYPEVESMTSLVTFKKDDTKLKYNDYTYTPNGMVVDSSFFKVFDFELKIGDKKNILKDTEAIILSESYCEKIFGDKNPIGEKVYFETRMYQGTHVVKGVMNIPSNSSLKFDYLIPNKGIHYGRTSMPFVRLKKDVNEVTFNEKIKTSNNNVPNWSPKLTESITKIISFKELYFSSDYTTIKKYSLFSSGNKKNVDVLFIIVFVILSISILNYSNLQIVNTNSVVKNMAIAKVNGALKKHILCQKLVENILVVGISVLIITILYNLILPFFNAFVKVDLAPPILKVVLINTVILLLMIGAGLIYPMLMIYKFSTLKNIKGNTYTANQLKGKRVMIVVQYALAFVLLISAMVVHKQLNLMLSKDLGFKSEGVMKVKLFYEPPFNLESRTWSKERRQEEYDKRIKIPEYLNNSLSSFTTIEKTTQGKSPIDVFIIDWKVKKEGVEFNPINTLTVTPDYLKMFDLKLLEGRFFEEGYDKQRGKKMLLNEAAIKYWNISDISSVKMLNQYWGGDFQIIGVIKDFNYEHLSAKPQPLVILFWDDPEAEYFIKFHKDNTQKGIKQIEALFNEINPNQTFKYSFLSDDIAELYQKEKRLSTIYIFFTMIALLISAIGLFTIALYDTQRRIKEIGVRKVNGATIKEILYMLNKDFIKWVLVAFVIACPVAYYSMSKWLENFAYKTTLSWWVFALAGLLTLVLALLTVSWQSYRAATQNPVESLRDE